MCDFVERDVFQDCIDGARAETPESTPELWSFNELMYVKYVAQLPRWVPLSAVLKNKLGKHSINISQC